MEPREADETVKSLIREAHYCSNKAAKMDPRDKHVYVLIDMSEKLLAAAEAIQPGSTGSVSSA